MLVKHHSTWGAKQANNVSQHFQWFNWAGPSLYKIKGYISVTFLD
jgi:hypothetical protein